LSTAIKSSVNDQVPAQRTRKGPKISDGIAALKRLREMPNLTGKCEPSQRMGNRKGLPELLPKLKHGVAFRQEVTKRIGLGFELPLESGIVGPNGPKIEVGVVKGVAVNY
jgi:hypothetical protein